MTMFSDGIITNTSHTTAQNQAEPISLILNLFTQPSFDDNSKLPEVLILYGWICHST